MGNNAATANGLLTLVIGDVEIWQGTGRNMPVIDGFHFADVSSVEPSFIRRIAPHVVVSSLVTQKSDAVEIAKKLAQMEYEGSYRVLINEIPNPDVVVQEIRTVAPELDFDVIEVSALLQKT